MSSNKMTFVRLGNSGLKVSRIILGTMSYGSPDWSSWVLGEKEGIEHVKFAYENGINTFDTANVYSNGESERILGKAIKQLNIPREDVVILTKVFFPVSEDLGNNTLGIPPNEWDQKGFLNKRGLSRKHIFDSIRASLDRLQLDYVDVLQCHRFDPETPIEETMQALHDVVKAGYARYIGMSSCWAYQFQIMQNYAITHNLTPFISLQNHYSLVYREEEREMMPTLKHFGVSSIPWSPLARGFLSRPLSETKKTTRSETDRFLSRFAEESHNEINRRVEKLAKTKGVSMAQLAIAWVMHKDVVAAPIIGTTSLDNLKDLLGAVVIKISEEEMKDLEEAYVSMGVVGHS